MASHDNAPAAPVGAATEHRVALVIGNSLYSSAPELRTAANDARAVSAVLARLGFDVIEGFDLDLHAFGDVHGAFEEQLESQPDVAFLFYAGHAAQVDGNNYLIPIDADISRKAHLATRALRLNDIMEPMGRAGPSLIFLDACRNNPLARNLARALGTRSADVGRGLAAVESGSGTLISFSAQPGALAIDGPSDGNSPTRPVSRAPIR